MSDDIKLPEPAGYFYERGVLNSVHRSFDYRDASPTRGHHTMRAPYFTADQLRAAVLSDRAERASAAEKPKTCTRCGGEMKPGQALESTLVGEPDDIGGCVTVSPGGPGKLVPCMKCSECGWSVTVGESK